MSPTPCGKWTEIDRDRNTQRQREIKIERDDQVQKDVRWIHPHASGQMDQGQNTAYTENLRYDMEFGTFKLNFTDYITREGAGTAKLYIHFH